MRSIFAFMCLICQSLASVAANDQYAPSGYVNGPEWPAVAEKATSSCAIAPLPTVPSGPSWSFGVGWSYYTTGESYGLTFWRRPCPSGGGNSQLLVTATNRYFCPGAFRSLYSGRVYIGYDADPSNGVIDTPECSSSAVTAVIAGLDPQVIDGQINFQWRPSFNANPNNNIDFSIPGYDPLAYFSGLELSGRLSGTYYDPARSGEGVSVEIGRVGDRRVVFLTWYTYFGGIQRWMAGNVDFPAGSREVTVPLIVTTGGQFGPAFNPSQVSATPWGTVTIRFPTCATMQFEWSENGGQAGAYNYQRLMDGLEGITCP